MMPDDKRMTLNVEYNITPVTVPTASGADVLLVGYMDYSVVTSHPLNAGELGDIFLS